MNDGNKSDGRGTWVMGSDEAAKPLDQSTGWASCVASSERKDLG